MEPKYRYSESTSKPSTLEIVKSSVYLRKDICEEKRVNGNGDEIIFYTYQEAVMSPDEFNEYTKLLAAQNTINGTNDSSNIVSLMNGQVVGDNNQLIIMEAIADLYDVIASMM